MLKKLRANRRAMLALFVVLLPLSGIAAYMAAQTVVVNALAATETALAATATAQDMTATAQDMTATAQAATNQDTTVTTQTVTATNQDTTVTTQTVTATTQDEVPIARTQTATTTSITSTPTPNTRTPTATPTVTSTQISIPPTEPQSPTPTVSRIREIIDKGYFTVAVVPDAPPFSVQNDGQFSGFEIDLMYELARRWFDDSDPTGRVRFIPVTYECRIHALRGHVHNEGEADCEHEDEADIIAAQLTHTITRTKWVDFSSIYLIDAQRLVVPTSSDIEDICGLKEDQKVAVLQNTTIPGNVKEETKGCTPSFMPDMNYFPSSLEAIESVITGDSAGFVMDSIALETLIKDKPLKLVGLPFSPQEYGIGLPKGDENFQKLVDITLCKMEKDNTLINLYYKYSEQFGYDQQPPDPYYRYSEQFGDDQQLLTIEMTCEEKDDIAETDVPPSIPPRPDDIPLACSKPYTVLRDDTLGHIAGKCNGDSSSWEKIYNYKENRNVIGDDPNKIAPGMVLEIPD